MLKYLYIKLIKNMDQLFIHLSIAFIFFVFWLVLFVAKRRKIHAIKDSLKQQLLLVSLPRDMKTKEGATIKDIIAVSEQILANLSQYKHTISLEIVNPAKENVISFYFSVPKKDISLFSKTITAFMPFAQVLPVQDYSLFTKTSHVTGADVVLKEKFTLKTRDYEEFSEDPLKSILNSFTKISDKEGGCLQIVLTPSNQREKLKFLLKEYKDTKNETLVVDEKPNTLKVMSDEFSKSFKKEDEDKKEEVKEINQEYVDSITKKLSKKLFDCNIRVVVSTNDKDKSDLILSDIENSFSDLENPTLNGFKFLKTKSKNFIFNYCYKLLNNSTKITLSTSEICSFWHLPHSQLELPNIKWLSSRTAYPPSNIPSEGLKIGYSDYRGDKMDINILPNDRRLHMYVIGKTGTGKSTYLKNMIVQDIQDGKGCCYIDPHGDMTEDLLKFIPENRIQDVVYLNPADLNHCIGLNILEIHPDLKTQQQTFIIEELLEIIDKLYNLKETGGPIFEQYLRNALILLMSDPEPHTLLEIPNVFVDDNFRKKLLSRTPNVMVKDFWEKQALKAGGDASLNNISPYINSKLTPFLNNDFVRPIIGQIKSTINFRDIMDNKKILLINLSKGNLGESSSYFLGMLLVGKIALAAYSRSNIPEEQRQDFYLYIDEFQNITTKTIPSILSEARKYRLNLIAAHQFIAQLKEDIRDSIFGNVGNIVAFRVGNEDAEYLAKYFTPVFEANDLINIDNRNAYAKIMIDGQPTRPFNIKTIKPDDPENSYVNAIKSSAINSYLIDKNQAEKNIQELFVNINKSAQDEKEKAYKEILAKINKEKDKND